MEQKAKTCVIIYVDIGKAFGKVQWLFIIKTLNKLGLEWNFLKLSEGIYEKPTANIIGKWWQIQSFPPKSGIRQVCPFSLHFEGVCVLHDEAKRRN